MQNVDATVISQFSNSPVLNQLIDNWNASVAPDYDLERFFTLEWDIDTAEGYGLDMLGRRVGAGRTLQIPTTTFLGFSGAIGASGDAFNAGVFYSGEPGIYNYDMPDALYRRVILAKAAANITNGSIPALNAILLILFPGRGNCYVQDNLNMSLTYVFTFPLLASEDAIIKNSGVLPSPAGAVVLYSYTGA